MERVTGIGGVFFKSRDPKALREWYERHLGIASPYGVATFDWRDLADPTSRGTTAWSPFKHDTTYFDPGTASFMINYRVEDLDAVMSALRAEGIEVDLSKEESEYGRFAWVVDPEGNRLELWEPPRGAKRTAARPDRPHAGEYAQPYAGYVSEVPDGDILQTLRGQVAALTELVGELDEEKSRSRYAEGKWSIAEVVGHLADGERAFSYRSFAISRGDQQPLPGFDEQSYTPNGRYDRRSITSLLDEVSFLRQSHLMLLENLDDEQWNRRGVASGFEVTVRALAWITAGHMNHHTRILRERYL